MRKNKTVRMTTEIKGRRKSEKGAVWGKLEK